MQPGRRVPFLSICSIKERNIVILCEKAVSNLSRSVRSSPLRSPLSPFPVWKVGSLLSSFYTFDDKRLNQTCSVLNKENGRRQQHLRSYTH